ncbi:ABC transporter substrate-binding protein [Polynucleobacter kasalickyi]|uniref:Amino acid/amide ABC transporter substrate-binding protein, HAAT family n=1 Tax=Polynucleobacter kasalickyi TaxID=1938817 RepID=A0A1W2C1T4_9BURK|nr:ABC transporter substrate-binding protein [Polynucleobacter kasalickyi]SMC79195.1 amino acid/amide ABC transporter substrate-binding protein, HAAT family [Polynucleobacter kasalickyi]
MKKFVPFVLATLFVSFSSTLVSQEVKVPSGAIRVGVLNDQSGVYSGMGGLGSVVAAKMAIEDFGGSVLGVPIELISADHQNKTDIGSSIAREWYDVKKVDVILDLAASNVGLAVMGIAKQKNKIVINTGSGSSRITNEDCNDRTAHWVYNTYALAHGTGQAVFDQGGDSWYFITADYAFGHSLEKDTTDVIKAGGGKVLGSIKHPLNASDFSSFLLQAQASGAKVIGLANAGTDAVNSIKGAKEFGLLKNKKQQIVGLTTYVTDVYGLGVETAQGIQLTEAFYWDMNPETRAWSQRFFERHKRMPSMIQAGTYSGLMHYLKAVKAAGTSEAGPVMAKMKSTPINDFYSKNGVLREDGLMVHDMYLFQVKTPEQSKSPWDLYTLKQTIPGNQAFGSLAESKCPLLKK